MNPFEMAQAQFDKAAALLDLDPATRELLRWPLREHSFAIPVRMDDGRKRMTCSYFEQVQSNMNHYWEKDEVLGRLDLTMTAAFQAVADLARRRGLPMRDAAYIIAVSRVAQACHDRGWV
ncbi:MAG TPA: hypothetical protein VEW48_16425 [Thermoanaerobaculia bacterium]|nr:hypothetical protein [Thermoanaerobaculia bacterium]